MSVIWCKADDRAFRRPLPLFGPSLPQAADHVVRRDQLTAMPRFPSRPSSGFQVSEQTRAVSVPRQLDSWFGHDNRVQPQAAPGPSWVSIRFENQGSCR
jgi:hypothetical protein